MNKKEKIYLVITVKNGDIDNISPFHEKDDKKMRIEFVKQCKKIDSRLKSKELQDWDLKDLSRGNYDSTYVVIEDIYFK